MKEDVNDTHSLSKHISSKIENGHCSFGSRLTHYSMTPNNSTAGRRQASVDDIFVFLSQSVSKQVALDARSSVEGSSPEQGGDVVVTGKVGIATQNRRIKCGCSELRKRAQDPQRCDVRVNSILRAGGNRGCYLYGEAKTTSHRIRKCCKVTLIQSYKSRKQTIARIPAASSHNGQPIR